MAKEKQEIKVQVEYGEKDLKEILEEILKEKYASYIAGSGED